MFSISDKDIAAIQTAFERGGELAAFRITPMRVASL
jgi:hypothetical protein